VHSDERVPRHEAWAGHREARAAHRDEHDGTFAALPRRGQQWGTRRALQMVTSDERGARRAESAENREERVEHGDERAGRREERAMHRKGWLVHRPTCVPSLSVRG
jgi:hypothetical protein